MTNEIRNPKSEIRNPKGQNANVPPSDDYRLLSFDIRHSPFILSFFGRRPIGAKVRAGALSPKRVQALARGNTGGSLRMLCRLGIGGSNVRNGPNAIPAQLA